MKKIFTFLLFVSLSLPNGLEAITASLSTMQMVDVDITFVVNTSELEIAEDGILFAASNTDFAGQPMTDNGDGTWSITVTLNSGDTISYNYLNGADGFEAGNTGDCFDEFGSRTLVVPTMATTLPLVYFNSCDDMPPPVEETIDITFVVDVTGLEIDDDGIFIGGDFNDFEPAPMTDNEDGTWSSTIPLVPGSLVFYNFLNGPSGWEAASGDCFDEFSSRSLEVPAMATTLPTVFLGSCDGNPPPVIETVDVTFSVNTAGISTPDGMFVLGGFSNFNEIPMEDMGDGIWMVTTPVPQNSSQQYNFSVGNFEFEIPVTAGGEGGCFDLFNSRSLEVGTEPIVLSTVYYGSCDNTPPAVLDMVDVTFTVDASSVEIEEAIYVVGTFNGWQALDEAALSDNGDGTYSITLPLGAGSTMNYNYQTGFATLEETEGPCFVETDGILHRTLVVPDAPLALPTVFWGGCAVDGSDSTSTSTTDLVVANSLNIAPNPFQVATTLTWANPNDNTYTVSIFDITGQLVNQFPQVTGTTLTLQRANLRAGMYVVKFQNEEGAIATRKLMIE